MTYKEKYIKELSAKLRKMRAKDFQDKFLYYCGDACDKIVGWSLLDIHEPSGDAELDMQIFLSTLNTNTEC